MTFVCCVALCFGTVDRRKGDEHSLRGLAGSFVIHINVIIVSTTSSHIQHYKPPGTTPHTGEIWMIYLDLDNYRHYLSTTKILNNHSRPRIPPDSKEVDLGYIDLFDPSRRSKWGMFGFLLPVSRLSPFFSSKIFFCLFHSCEWFKSGLGWCQLPWTSSSLTISGLSVSTDPCSKMEEGHEEIPSPWVELLNSGSIEFRP